MQPSSVVLATALAWGAAGVVYAHGGGLNKEGCHTNRKSGDYHCHNGGSTSRPTRNSHAPANSFAPSLRAPSQLSTGSRPFANCSEARAAGAAPVRRGDPGYGAHLDRDNDGIGCEPYRGRR